MIEQDEKPQLLLKWGSIKGWSNSKEGSALRKALVKWAEDGVSAGAMQQRETDSQKEAICEAIDAVFEAGGEVINDWSGEQYESAESAKKYILEYRT